MSAAARRAAEHASGLSSAAGGPIDEESPLSRRARSAVGAVLAPPRPMHPDPLIRRQLRRRALRTLGGGLGLATCAAGLALCLIALWRAPTPTTRRVVWTPDDAPVMLLQPPPRAARPDAPQAIVHAPPPVDPQAQLDALWEELQRARARGGPCRGPAPALSWDATLDEAAQAQADWMRIADDWAHETPDNPAGATPSDRARIAGYPGYVTGEILAWGQRTPRAAVRWWLRSPPHCRALLDPDGLDAGVAVTRDPFTDGWVWAVVFGA